MLDFTSALYLGLRHPSAALAPWDALTLGRPAALREPRGAAALAADLARLQGCEAALLLPSTLHLFWDLFRLLAGDRAVILRDAGAYPIPRWGTERAAALGIPVRAFPHHDVEALGSLIRAAARDARMPIVVTDGYCPGCGDPAPVRNYADLARSAGGYLVLDDTQALGILGRSPRAERPYGEGGGGSLRWHGVFGPHIVVGSSLAKAFGAPVAVLAGSQALINRFREESEIRIHCSPPSLAVIEAARRALGVNEQFGDRLRRRLIALVQSLRRRLSACGLTPRGRLPFPVQPFTSQGRIPAEVLYQRLLQSGVRGLLTRACEAVAASLTFVITARHEPHEIEDMAQAVLVATGDRARAS
jgi:8-amino-7-oxononanoate synthase